MSIEVDDFGQIGRVSATAPDGARIWILLANGVTAVATNSAEPFAFERGDTVLVTGFDVQPAPPEAWPDDAERAVRPDQPWVGVVNLREEEATIVDVGGGLEQVIYVEAVESLRADLGVPLAIETGVNYLRPRADEMPDATFMAAVAERADCGILLDLHNVYCNALNGRQEVEEFLSGLPLERVWEVHVAGGFELEDFWLDAHSGAIPDPLLRICRDVVPALPSRPAISA